MAQQPIADAAPSETGRAARYDSIDILRGLVMIVMALDHVRDFFGHPGVNPTNLATTTSALFLTRWITHLCAPTFCLLVGLGAGLTRRYRSTVELARYLWTRGAWLLVLELVVVRCLGLQFNFDYRVTILTVLWSLGWSMIVLGVLVRLKLRPWTIAAIGAFMILGHNLLDARAATGAMPAPGGASGAAAILAPLMAFLHRGGMLFANQRFLVLVGYPLIPWPGVAMVGFGLAEVYAWDAERRRRFLWRGAAALSLAFVVLRALNVYGDPSPWSAQATLGRTLLSFLNTTKYPPSLLFLLMTLGPALGLLAALDGVDLRARRWLRPALTYGRVPMFYYLVHLTMIHTLAVAVCFARLGEVHWMFESPRLDQFPFAPPPGWGFDLPAVYLAWLTVVVLMYPLCRAYGEFKRTRRSPRQLKMLSYL